MTETANKRKGWVKNAIIIFLAVMLFLTLFSNTILNYSLPEVSAQYASYGQLTSVIRASGTVEAVSTYRVYTEESRVIESIAVRRGDMVEKGQVLFVLEQGDSGELKEAMAALEAEKETLKQLELAYEKYLIEMSPEYSDSQKSLNDALKAYNEALALSKKVGELSAAYDSAVQMKKTAQDKVDKLEKELGKITGELVYDDIASALAAARGELYQAENALAAAERNLNSIKGNAELYQSNAEMAESQLQSLIARQSELESVKSSYRALDDMYLARQENIAARDALLAILPPEPGEGDAATLQQIAQLEATIAAQDLQIQRSEQDLRIQGHFYSYPNSTQALINELTGIGQSVQSAQLNADRYRAMAEQAQSDLTKAQVAYDEAKQQYDACKSRVAVLENSENAEALNVQLDSARKELDTASEAVTDAAEQKEEAERAEEDLERLKEAYETLKKSVEKADKLEEYTNNDKKEAIEKQKKAVEEKQAAVDKLQDKESGAYEVLSKVNGTVSSIDCYAGQSVTRDSLLATIEISDMGYTAQVSVTNEQARRLRVGDPVSIQNNWYDATAQITAIKNEQGNSQGGKTVTLSVTGGVSVGQQLTFALGEKTTSYQTTVPNSAVYEDNQGKFVLAVEVKASPLGNRYIARRMPIEVVSFDETTSAITGLNGNEFVITSSTMPVSDGQQVKMIEK